MIVDQVRGFNRFYTRQIGLLREQFLQTPYSLTQARVLYELGRDSGITAKNLIEELGLDKGYLSRLLREFEKQGLVKRSSSKEDRRVSNLALTAKGRAEFKTLDAKSREETAGMLAKMSEAQRERLIQSMMGIQALLDPHEAAAPEFPLRTHKPGDIGWVVKRHAELYAQEYGWDASFEGLVAEIAGAFLRNFDAKRERCWIAERAGDRLGCVFLVKDSKKVAKLRLLLVEPSARGLGIGARLVGECLEFARQCGYKKVTLWTNDILHAARKVYEAAGFSLVKEEKHHSFGHDLVGQSWELKL